MAQYTTTIFTMIQTNFDFGLVEYPIFDESYRTKLNDKILEHYMFREIGHETAERFKWELNVKMNEIMPYYNQLYQSALLTIEPLVDFRKEVTTTSSEVTDNTMTESIDEDTIENAQQDATQDITNNTTEETVIDTDNISNVDNTSSTDSTSNSTSENTSSEDNFSNNQSQTDENNIQKVNDLPHGQTTFDNDYLTNLTETTNENISDTTTIGNTKSNSNDIDSSTETNSTEEQTNTVSSEDTSVNKVGSDTTSNISNNKSNRISNKALMKALDNDINKDFNSYILEEGFSTSQAELLTKFRQTFLNIDMQVIQDLHELFMLIY